MSTMASQITGVSIVYSTVYSGTNQRKHQRSASLVFERGIHRWPVNSPHKRPVTRKNVSIWWRHHGVWLGISSWFPFTLAKSLYIMQPQISSTGVDPHMSSSGLTGMTRFLYKCLDNGRRGHIPHIYYISSATIRPLFVWHQSVKPDE